jgi:hypothetical protein
MCLCRGIGVFALAALVLGAETGSYEQASRRAYTVAVDSRTGNLIRVPVRPARPLGNRQPQAPAQAARPVSTPSRDKGLHQAIQRIAENHGIHPSFVHAVIKAESNYDPLAVSPKGAQGLMQLMPQTAQQFGVRNVFDPVENVRGGVEYLRHLLDQYGDAGVTLAAYNAGPGAVERYGGVPPYRETQQFVRRVNRFYDSFRAQAGPAMPPEPPKKAEGPRIYWFRDGRGNIHYTTAAP